MGTGHGRDQLGPMERLTQILTMLSAADRHTLSVDDLLEAVPYGAGKPEDQRDQLRRDVRHLESLGWQIDNVAPSGETTRYRLTAIDNRLRVEFTVDQRHQLLRAAHVARLHELAVDLGGDAPVEPDDLEVVTHPDSALSLLQRAVAQHCLLRFRYRNKQRTVHPHGLHMHSGGWYLTANEDGAEEAKTFAVRRMSAVHIDSPGSARIPARASHPQLDPITWRVDPETNVVVETTEEHRHAVENMLGAASSVDSGPDDTLRLTIPVTHRAAFRRRLYELGTRVLLVGPDEVRDEVRAELVAVAGELR